MSSFLKYQVLSDEGYNITNGRLGGPCEDSEIQYGHYKYPPIIITSYSGETVEELYERSRPERIPKKTWENAIAGKTTGKWALTYVSVQESCVEFYFDYTGIKKDSYSVSVHARKDTNIRLKVPREDGLPPAEYLIDAYSDRSEAEYYHIRVTEFYDRMKRQISIESKTCSGSPGYEEYLLITEYRE